MKNETNHIIMILAMVISGAVTLSDDQIAAIVNIVFGGAPPQVKGMTPPANQPVGETICGMSELAKLLGTSVPTACKISRSGKFDAARLNFGTKKFVWDRRKLMEIARTDNTTSE